MSSSVPAPSFLRRQYNWLMRTVDTPYAEKTLAGIAFFESSVFPLPPDLMLIPMILSNPKKAWRLAALCSLMSILGGLLGYGLGYFLYDSVGTWIINTYNLHSAFQNFQTTFQQWGFWIIMAKGLTPIPFKLVTIASGVCKLSIWKFFLACVITRTSRFFLLAALVQYLGVYSKDFIEKYLGWILLASLGLIGAGVYAVKYL